MSPTCCVAWMSWPLGALCGWLLALPLVAGLALGRRWQRRRRIGG